MKFPTCYNKSQIPKIRSHHCHLDIQFGKQITHLQSQVSLKNGRRDFSQIEPHLHHIFE